MYITIIIIILPLLITIVSGFFGRKTGVSGSQIIICTAVVTTTILAVLAFFEVGLNNLPVSIEVFNSYMNNSNITLVLLISLSLVHFRANVPNVTIYQSNMGTTLNNIGDNIKYIILTIIFNFTWNTLVYFILLRIIKSPVSWFISSLVSDPLFFFCILILIGTIITYFWHKYIWDRYFKGSYLYSLLDRSIFEDILQVALFFFPLLVINYFTAGFGGYFVLVSAAELANMPGLSPNTVQQYRNTISGNLDLSFWHKVKYKYGNPNGLRKLEVVVNALGKESNPDSKQIGLRDAFNEHFSLLYEARRRLKETGDAICILENHYLRTNPSILSMETYSFDIDKLIFETTRKTAYFL